MKRVRVKVDGFRAFTVDADLGEVGKLAGELSWPDDIQEARARVLEKAGMLRRRPPGNEHRWVPTIRGILMSFQYWGASGPGPLDVAEALATILTQADKDGVKDPDAPAARRWIKRTEAEAAADDTPYWSVLTRAGEIVEIFDTYGDFQDYVSGNRIVQVEIASAWNRPDPAGMVLYSMPRDPKIPPSQAEFVPDDIRAEVYRRKGALT